MPLDNRVIPNTAIEVIPGLLEWRSSDDICCLVLNWRAVTDESINLLIENDYLKEKGKEIVLDSVEDYFLKVKAPTMGGVDSPLWQQEFENNWDAATKKLAAFHAFEFHHHTKHYVSKLPNCPVHISIDFGYHHPCAMIAQSQRYGYGDLSGLVFYHFHDVIRGIDLHLDKFLDVLLEHVNLRYPLCEQFWYTVQEGDTPSGTGIASKSEAVTPVGVMWSKGIYPQPRKYSIISDRVDLCNKKLSESYKGRPVFNFNGANRDWIDMLEGGYRREKIKRFGQLVPASGYFKDGYYDHLADSWGAWVVCAFGKDEKGGKLKPRKRREHQFV